MKDSQIELASETKFCVNCKNYRQFNGANMCSLYSYKKLNLVTGEHDEFNFSDCIRNRHDESVCGESGKAFVPK